VSYKTVAKDLKVSHQQQAHCPETAGGLGRTWGRLTLPHAFRATGWCFGSLSRSMWSGWPRSRLSGIWM